MLEALITKCSINTKNVNEGHCITVNLDLHQPRKIFKRKIKNESQESISGNTKMHHKRASLQFEWLFNKSLYSLMTPLSKI